MRPYLAPPLAALVMLGIVAAGAYLVAVLDRVAASLVARRPLHLSETFSAPVATAVL